ncbi:Crp/Fnr family transcriptional regulator [Tropicimonas isoalkanivorans]|uniref:CRP/FNR family transcriptional regulator, anaerobic regulatory protein n=1 Tax=Tropicimonas isoalkanivorans TaxID=441112 RepID=A0A1I1EHX5_9RHOB|nr:Crp/Fnr family transcriptional regulator [Tropicimonas isoalkanivorans]SFB86266.1 CRP/FNR family transcriptional regulator, anaerobic regulatory protein [Tropicimonas isoalkanivorans]
MDTSAPLKDDLPCIACQQRLCRFVDGQKPDITPLRIELQRGDRLECMTGNCLKFWSVVRGTTAVCTVLKDGRRQIVALAGPRDAICGMLADGHSPHWLEALEPCEVCEIDFTPRAAILAKDARFMRALMDIMHDQLVRTSQHLITLGRLDSTERVILFIGQLALCSAAEDGTPRPVTLPMSREDIADYLGLNAETVSRILTKLRKSGLVKFLNRSEFVVPDLDALRRRLPMQLMNDQASVIGQFADGRTGERRAQA